MLHAESSFPVHSLTHFSPVLPFRFSFSPLLPYKSNQDEAGAAATTKTAREQGLFQAITRLSCFLMHTKEKSDGIENNEAAARADAISIHVALTHLCVLVLHLSAYFVSSLCPLRLEFLSVLTCRERERERETVKCNQWSTSYPTKAIMKKEGIDGRAAITASLFSLIFSRLTDRNLDFSRKIYYFPHIMRTRSPLLFIALSDLNVDLSTMRFSCLQFFFFLSDLPAHVLHSV